MKITIFFLISFALYGQTVDLKRGLVVHYPISGNLIDVSGNVNDGIVDTEAVYAEDRFGNPKGALYLDGVQSEIWSKNSESINTLGIQNAFCISVWVYVEDWGEDEIFPIVHKAVSFSKNAYSLTINPKGLYIKDRKEGFGFDYKFSQKKWYHIVANYASIGNQEMAWGFEINDLGNKSTEKVLQGPDMSNVSLYFGKTKTFEDNVAKTIFAKGRLDDIRVYNRIIEKNEVKLLFEWDESQDMTEKEMADFASINSKKENLAAENSNILKESNQKVPVPEVDRGDKSSDSETDLSSVPGKYYALIIGNNDYIDPEITSLDKPFDDASELYEILVNQYNFEKENVKLLKNAKYEETIQQFDDFTKIVKPTDNFLVFYAGHGFWDKDKELGYWMPVDSKKINKAQWLSNSLIKDYMHSINSKHTLLIADACFSGSIFKSRAAFADASLAINKLYDLPSRKAMTSGTLKTVPDESVFLKYLVKKLTENQDDYLSSDELFMRFRIAVTNNSKTTPLYGVIQETGDEGGEFIFVKRK
ncbi:hypothetical protein EGI22_11250 [Lacihabitans sp. LS3-19]|uniref:caspase family protein n=1 Tax=Lacihabitans sp. LS3-19 TaxID=2487335 RepID=UPI0020CF2302|nr:caspase family protein [Lacihabitans sp. LS3-19]MCP9768490.1 hypothetical protein [Lacihabitans sp. LS3-19]